MLTLSHFSAYSIALPTIIGIITFRKNNSTLRKLSVLVFFTAFAELVTTVMFSYSMNNLFAFHLHTIVEMTILSLIFLDLFKGKFRPKLATLVILGFWIYTIVNVIFFEPLSVFNANQRYVAGIIIILYSLMYYQQMFQELSVERIETHPYFWLCSSLFIYFAGTLFLFILIASKHAQAGSTDSELWNLRSILNINLNLGYSITLWMGKKLI